MEQEMQDEQIEERFKKIVAEIYHVDVSKLNRNTRFVEDLHTKSIDMIELCALAEEEFRVEIPIGDAMKNKTVGEAIDYIKKKLQACTR
jgi:acyl carrier protein